MDIFHQDCQHWESELGSSKFVVFDTPLIKDILYDTINQLYVAWYIVSDIISEVFVFNDCPHLLKLVR